MSLCNKGPKCSQMLQQKLLLQKGKLVTRHKLWISSLRGQWRISPDNDQDTGEQFDQQMKTKKAITRSLTSEDQIPGERLHNGEKHIIVRNRRGSITMISPGKQAEQEGEPEKIVTVQSESLKPWRASCWSVRADSQGSDGINLINK